MFNFFKNLKRWFGYERVAVVRVKKANPVGLYNPEKDEIKVSRQWRRYYQLDIKNALWNIKNFIKYKLNMSYVKANGGIPHFRTVYYNSKILARKEGDFAVIPKNLVDIAKTPIKSSITTVGTVDRPQIKL